MYNSREQKEIESKSGRVIRPPGKYPSSATGKLSCTMTSVSAFEDPDGDTTMTASEDNYAASERETTTSKLQEFEDNTTVADECLTETLPDLPTEEAQLDDTHPSDITTPLTDISGV